jgi:hypothetical protein
VASVCGKQSIKSSTTSCKARKAVRTPASLHETNTPPLSLPSPLS